MRLTRGKEQKRGTLWQASTSPKPVSPPDDGTCKLRPQRLILRMSLVGRDYPQVPPAWFRPGPWPLASAVPRRQQAIERTQLDHQQVQQGGVARLDRLGKLREARERAIDQAAKLSTIVDRARRHAVAPAQRSAI